MCRIDYVTSTQRIPHAVVGREYDCDALSRGAIVIVPSDLRHLRRLDENWPIGAQTDDTLERAPRSPGSSRQQHLSLCLHLSPSNSKTTITTTHQLSMSMHEDSVVCVPKDHGVSVESNQRTGLGKGTHLAARSDSTTNFQK